MSSSKDGLHTDAHGVTRCWWCVGDPLYEAYHDTEWGFPAVGDNRLYENICLDGFQAGLSWLTILRKRESFRAAFAGFEIERVARFNKRTVDRLLRDAGIIRHRGKIEAAINNARRAIELIEEFGSLAAYVWRYEPSPRARTKAVTRATMPTTSAESIAMSKDLKRRGWSFVGPTTLYAFMQAMGLVDDHLIGCDVRPRVESARQAFVRPASR
ncbi:MAG: DNA-3-methyladenine glycosylase I [Phycisphaerales bacterium]|nr:DNA-3-methyladenine glycosylase I [Planctomycetota bacterium]MCZ6542817.1 DNA-3-methyladenine glycosylase I [Planctomycetota bacterium]MCZ6735877.1 DNA-3-methyladenine glycosylase I [Planctomycetota bacterium]MCZ6811603.1 DNA-3-methyladenine glycosylase I [Planctomycetota bacterium]MCZ6850511.1 DNA-3-methyladenine glycosylase I [Planctomycetota bacterium]